MKYSVCRFLFLLLYLREGISNLFKCMKVVMVILIIGLVCVVYVYSVFCFDCFRDNLYVNL